MITKDKIIIIEKLIADYRKLRAFDNQLNAIFRCFTPEAIWTAFDHYTDSVSEQVGDREQWIAWFIYENDCGDRALKAGKGKRLRPVKTAKDLVKIIEP